MKAKLFFFLPVILLLAPRGALAQTSAGRKDSATVRVLPAYDSVSRIHRYLFGENYRKEYATALSLPVIHLSQIGKGGLHATERGGGFQTRSLRLVDSSGREYTLRGVEKYPEMLLPAALRETFVKEIIKDNMSAQHPFSALVVPPLAEAINAPHSSPLIGIVAADAALGSFAADFVNTICLLEEREPAGKTDNTAKMLARLRADNDNTVDAQLYLKLKCLDVLLGDWDRHEDQWRWKTEKTAAGLRYQPVPRDRDQVFYSSDGLVQRIAQGSWFLPMMQGYERPLKDINWFLWEGREINSKWFSQISREEWDSTVRDFCAQMSDELLEGALRRLPGPIYQLRHTQLLKGLHQRREQMPALMARYYQFFNRIVDVELSDKNESVALMDGQEGILIVRIQKIAKAQPGKLIYERTLDPRITKELRIYLHNGSDSLSLNSHSPIKIRIIAGEGEKSYQVQHSAKPVQLYAPLVGQTYSGDAHTRLRRHLSPDSANTAYVAKDLYSRHLVFPSFGLNSDDGLALGLSLKLTSPGFRKSPYGSAQSFSFLYSFATSAIKFYYTGEWIKAIGSADLVVNASAFSPSNTQNFFGLGNQSSFDKELHGLSYYRARFNWYSLDPSLRWRGKRSSFSAGPSAEYYSYDSKGNQDRLIANSGLLHSADSATVDKAKGFLGVVLKYNLDTRDHALIPTRGLLLESRLAAFEGLNRYANRYGQFNASLSLHQRLNATGRVVISERIGGGLTAGKATFYQSQFLGGQGNLLGYRQYRFAGDELLFNNLELRLKIGNFASYILPGQIGLIGLYDIGRVWRDNERAKEWHQGVGGGLYFAPASLSLLRLVAGYSKEGWYPYFAFSVRY